ncbi:MAG: hypothetical protein R3313_03265, partial [Candidatus Saccharimonadales bacterium]|nr:hypothetical protein [Candidatus Saccharimonadales bacterium]
MLPGDVAFPFAHCLTQDSEGRGLFLELDFALDEDAKEPAYLPPHTKSGRVGLMRIYQEHEGKVLDGYLVDITEAKPGEIITRKVWPTDDDIPEGDIDFREYADSEQAKWTPVLALVYLDPEGEIQFVGPEWLQDSAEHLKAVYEE